MNIPIHDKGAFMRKPNVYVTNDNCYIYANDTNDELFVITLACRRSWLHMFSKM
ncbi:hypothetical protein ABES11_27815 [Bacillus paranthracis]|uniref:hypothetical protein n=1 Tax=Bacillus cereus group TaxID=86661 RepID=UPI00016B72AD|nr:MULTISPECIES: hypothetical protein [Bacillus cereus group]MCC2431340.1 hypothetical protein [Bacillus paranthracis]MDX5913869.1 hypothetical protein [Bacillus cereus group sp. BfR-BA-01026]